MGKRLSFFVLNSVLVVLSSARVNGQYVVTVGSDEVFGSCNYHLVYTRGDVNEEDSWLKSEGQKVECYVYDPNYFYGGGYVGVAFTVRSDQPPAYAVVSIRIREYYRFIEDLGGELQGYIYAYVAIHNIVDGIPYGQYESRVISPDEGYIVFSKHIRLEPGNTYMVGPRMGYTPTHCQGRKLCFLR